MTMSDLVPTADLAEVAQYAAASETAHDVLVETIRSGQDTGQLLESGRTWCSSDDAGEYRDAIERFPAAIDLSGCPPDDTVVTWHTHTTRDQLANPDHSIPDIANVAFGRVDVSIIPGIESDHLLVASADRDQMAETFRSVTGIDADGPTDVTAAMDTGQVTDPPQLRERLFAEFDTLEKRIDTGRDYMRPHVDALFEDGVDTGEDCCGLHTLDDAAVGGDHIADDPPEPPVAGLRANAVLRREARVSQSALNDAVDRFDITETVVGTAVGMFTSRLLERAVFGE